VSGRGEGVRGEIVVFEKVGARPVQFAVTLRAVFLFLGDVALIEPRPHHVGEGGMHGRERFSECGESLRRLLVGGALAEVEGSRGRVDPAEAVVFDGDEVRAVVTHADGAGADRPRLDGEADTAAGRLHDEEGQGHFLAVGGVEDLARHGDVGGVGDEDRLRRHDHGLALLPQDRPDRRNRLPSLVTETAPAAGRHHHRDAFQSVVTDRGVVLKPEEAGRDVIEGSGLIAPEVRRLAMFAGGGATTAIEEAPVGMHPVADWLVQSGSGDRWSGRIAAHDWFQIRKVPGSKQEKKINVS